MKTDQLHNSVLWFQTIVGILVSVCCVAAVPFSLEVDSRLSSIETTLKQYGPVREKIEEIEIQLARNRHNDVPPISVRD